MADILTFNTPSMDLLPEPVRYQVNVTLYPNDLEFTVREVKTDAKSLLQVADELEKIVRIIRTDVVTGIV